MAYVLIIVPWGYDYLPYFCRHPYNLHKLCWQLLLTSITTTIANLTLLRARAQIFTPQLGPNPFWTGKVQIPMECHNQRAATKRDTAWIVGVFLYFPSVVPLYFIYSASLVRSSFAGKLTVAIYQGSNPLITQFVHQTISVIADFLLISSFQTYKKTPASFGC